MENKVVLSALVSYKKDFDVDSDFAKHELNQINEAIKEIQRFTDGYNVAIVWNVDDILQQAEHLGITMSIDEAKHTLYRLVRCHDAEVGINWDTIDNMIMGCCHE